MDTASGVLLARLRVDSSRRISGGNAWRGAGVAMMLAWLRNPRNLLTRSLTARPSAKARVARMLWVSGRMLHRQRAQDRYSQGSRSDNRSARSGFATARADPRDARTAAH